MEKRDTDRGIFGNREIERERETERERKGKRENLNKGNVSEKWYYTRGRIRV